MDLLLIGRSGNGKSATGNNILRRECFTKNNDSYAKSSKPKSDSGVFEDQQVIVVDGLCLQEDSFTNCVRDAHEALRMGNGGFTALVFVLRYGEKFGADEANLVKLAKRVFGNDVVRDYGLCVVTRGDDFKYAVEEGEETVGNFYEWCRKQSGALKTLLHECKGRAVLFDNKTKDDNKKKKQLSDLLGIVREIQLGGVGRYTVDKFSKIHGKPLLQDSETNSAEFDRKTRDKIREIGERVVTYLKDGSPDEKLRKSLQEDLRELSISVSHTLEDKENKLKYIQQIQDLSDKIKESRPSHHEVDKGEAHLPQSVQPRHAGDMAQQRHAGDMAQQRHAGDMAQQRHAGDMAQQRLDRGNGQNLHLLLLGRTGNGKSSTGNSILGRPAFKPSASTSSATTEVLSDSETIDGQLITVIDGPGLDDTEKTSEEDFLASISSMEKALDLCDYGFSAIIVVLRFGFRFTRQESDAIRMMRSILGKGVLKKYGVCLMTHGDNFDYEMTQDVEEGEAVSFREWCDAQAGDIRALFEECNFRHVLFDNKTRDKEKMAEQRQKLLSLIPTGGCYSKDEFLASERDLVELNLEFILPKLEQKTNEKLETFRENVKTIDRDCGTDDNEYFKQMESLLANVTEFKEMIVSLGQNKATDFFIMQLNALEMEVNTKRKLRAQIRDIKSMEGSTASQACPERVPAPQGSAGQYGPGKAHWSSEIHDPGTSHLSAASLRPGASPRFAPAQGYESSQWPQKGGSGSDVPMETWGPAGIHSAPSAVSGSEVTDVKKQTRGKLQEMYAEFLQPSRDVKSHIRKTERVHGKLMKLKETFKEIANGRSCYEDVSLEINNVEHKILSQLEHDRRYASTLLAYPHPPSCPQGQVLECFGFEMIDPKCSSTLKDPHRSYVDDKSNPAMKFVKKKWRRAKNFFKFLKKEFSGL